MVPLMIAGMGMSAVSSIMGAKAQSAAAKAANRQAHKNWIAANTQKTFANAREQFNAAYQFSQQMKRNDAIGQAAYQTQSDSTSNVNDSFSINSSQMSSQLRQANDSLKNAILSKGISASSGLYSSMATAQALGALANMNQMKKNRQIQLDNVNRQFKAQMGQQTNNIFMPNIQGYDETPLFGNTDPTGAMIGGVLGAVGGGLVSIGGAMGNSAGTPDAPNGSSGSGFSANATWGSRAN